MTRAEADRLFSSLALLEGKPSPPDPFLRFTVRAHQAVIISEELREELDGVITDLARVLERATALREEMSAWTAVAQSYAEDAARAAADSGWPELLTAMEEAAPLTHRDRCIRSGVWPRCACGAPVMRAGDTRCFGCSE